MNTPLSVQQPAPGTQNLWAAHAWVDNRWQEAVAFELCQLGNQRATWGRVTAGSPRPTEAAPHVQVIDGPIVPPLVNAHSHAFQRAFAGLTERRTQDGDDFWSWREQMYGVALTITPAELRRIATTLYRELLAGGYSHVCEFHYLHHAPDGTPYTDDQGGPLAMSQALIDAAQDVGMGLTLLPVLYERAGFAQPHLGERQRRFRTSVDDVLALRDGIAAIARQLPPRAAPLHTGVAIHSLRAATRESVIELARRTRDDAHPIHIHISEQMGEVNDCLSSTGMRPIEWLCRGLPTPHEPHGACRIDPRWHLVHATHATRDEIHAVAASGAQMVLCPTTEANLGDGLTDLPGWLNAGVGISIGSDSHACRQWTEELRLAEYGQRLLHRQRNVLASASQPSCAERLYTSALAAGAAAAGLGPMGFASGAPARWLSLPPGNGCVAAAHGQWLDVAVFST